MKKKMGSKVLDKAGKVSVFKGGFTVKITGITAGMMAMVSSAYCSASVDELGNKVIKMLFNILFLGGIVFLANGIRLFVSAVQQGGAGTSRCRREGDCVDSFRDCYDGDEGAADINGSQCR